MSKIVAPRLNPNDDFVMLGRWLVTEGQKVRSGDAIAELVSSKVVFILHAESDGYIQFAKSKNQKVKVGEEVASLSSEPAPKSEATRANTTFSGGAADAVFSAGAAKRIQELGGSTADFEGQGLITQKMVEKKYLAKGFHIRTDVEKSEDISPQKRAEIEALSLGAQALVSRLTIDFNSGPLLESLQRRGFTFKSATPLILFETYRLIKEKHKKLNASFADEQIIYHRNLKLGYAIDTGNGLKVAHLKLDHFPSPSAIEERIVELTLADLRNAVQAEDFELSTFTVTDLSQFQILDFDPLINGPQAGILGIGGDLQKPEAPMRLILSFDHRILSGREAAVFLNDLRKSVLAYGNS